MSSLDYENIVSYPCIFVKRPLDKTRKMPHNVRMLPHISLPTLIQEIPKHGDKVWYWPSETSCNVAIVAEVVFQPELPIRPRLNLCVFDPLTAKPFSRIGVPCVLDDYSAGTPRTQRWSLFTTNE